MQRRQYDGEHEYLVSPESVGDYPITDNETHSTYDQFIQLRDTLIFSGKYYNDKAWAKLIVWESKETIEVLFHNLFRQSYNNLTQVASKIALWPYVSYNATIAGLPQVWALSCVIEKDWWYRLTYKMEVLPTYTQRKVYTYFDIYRPRTFESPDPFPYTLLDEWWTAVFDWECNTGLNWTTSWTEPSGSCYVPISLWRIFKKLTASWCIEKNLKKWDIVVLRAKDAERWPNPIPAWINLTLQANSNYWSIEYLNLPINN